MTKRLNGLSVTADALEGRADPVDRHAASYRRHFTRPKLGEGRQHVVELATGQPEQHGVRGVEVGERLAHAPRARPGASIDGTGTPRAASSAASADSSGVHATARANRVSTQCSIVVDGSHGAGRSYADGGGTGTCSSLKKLRFAPACRQRARWSIGRLASAASSNGSRGAESNGSEFPTPTTGSAHGRSVRAAAEVVTFR